MEGIIVQTTTSTQEEAKLIAHSLISKKFAACVTIIPNCISLYSWKQKIQEDIEFELQIKSFKILNKMKLIIISLLLYEINKFYIIKNIFCSP